MGVLNNLNYIKSTAYYPCAHPNPILIIEAGLTAAAPVIMQAATFGCLDILRMRAGMSPWHARGLRMLANGIISPESSNQALKLYQYIIPLEKALFFNFVVDLTTEFFAIWQSQIFKLGGCGAPANGQIVTSDTCQGFGTKIDEWHPIGIGNYTTHGRPGYIVPPYLIVPPNYHFAVNFTVNPVSLIQGQPVSKVQTTIRELTPHPITFTPMEAEAGFFNTGVKGWYSIHNVKPKPFTRTYICLMAADVLSFSNKGSFNAEVSEVPSFSAGLFPVNCLGQIPNNILQGSATQPLAP